MAGPRACRGFDVEGVAPFLQALHQELALPHLLRPEEVEVVVGAGLTVRTRLPHRDRRLRAAALDARQPQRVVAGRGLRASHAIQARGSVMVPVTSRTTSGVPSGATLVTISITEKNWLRNATLPGMTTRPVTGGISKPGSSSSCSTGKNGSAAIEKLSPGRSNCCGNFVSVVASCWLSAAARSTIALARAWRLQQLRRRHRDGQVDGERRAVDVEGDLEVDGLEVRVVDDDALLADLVEAERARGDAGDEDVSDDPDRDRRRARPSGACASSSGTPSFTSRMLSRK